MSLWNETVGGYSVFNLSLNIAGLIDNKKNVALYILNEDKVKAKSTTITLKKEFKQEILQPIENTILNKAAQITGFLGLNTAYMSAEINEQSKLMEHPIEDGTVTADFKVRMPTEITVRITLPEQKYEDILAELKEYKDKGQMLYVETKYGNFKNMQIVSIPVQLTVENISRLTFSIKLKEVIIHQKVFGVANPADIKDTVTVNQGQASLVKQYMGA